MSSSAPVDLGSLLASLDNADAPIQQKIESIGKIKDIIEPVALLRVTQILETGLSSILKLLRETPPSFVDDNNFKLRSAIIQLLQRFPLTDVLTPHVGVILSAIMQVAYSDCEENGVACMRHLFDLHKAYKEAAAAHTADFFDFVVRCYSNMPKIAQALLAAEAPPAAAPVADAPGASPASVADMPSDDEIRAIITGDRKMPCCTSFQVVAELPLVVIVLLQLHPRSLKVQVARMVPQMMQTLQLQVQQGTDRASPLHKRQEELVVAQVKTVSFMTYLLRSFTNVLEPNKQVVGKSILRLLQNCPPAPEGLSLRREVLVACRHMLASEFKDVFTPHVDVMLNETLLLGHNQEGAPSKALRPLAISTLADLLHGVRRTLSLAQLGKVVSLFARNIHDSSLPTAIQCTSVRLLLNLVDSIYHNKDADGEIGRALLSRILSALVQKFGALQHYIPHVVVAARRAMLSRLALRRSRSEQLAHTVLLGAVSRGDIPAEDAPAMQAAAKARVRESLPDDVGASRPMPGMSSAADGFTETGDGATAEDRDVLSRLNGYDPLLASITSSITSSNRTHRAFVDIMACVKDVKTLMKTMSLGLKTLVWCVSNYRRGPTPGSAASDADPHKLVKPGGGGALTESELDLISKFVKWGLRCFMIFTHLPPHVDWQGVSVLGLEQDNSQSSKPSGDAYTSKRASSSSGVSNSQSMLMLGTPEQVEMTNFFASVFTILDAHNFRDLMNKHLPLLFRYIIAYPPLQTIVQHLLANERAARPFADLVLQYLVRHIHLLNPEGPADVTRSVYVAAAAADRAAKQHGLGNSTEPPSAVSASFGPVTPVQPPAAMYGESAVAFGAREPAGAGVAKPSITVGPAGEDAAYTRGYQYSRAGITGGFPEANPLPGGPATSRIAPAHFVMSLTDPLAPAITASVPLVMFSPTVRSSVLVRLFRITVASITHLFTKHEPILRPYIATIVLGVLRDMLHTNNPTNHLQLLKALFKSVSSGDQSGTAPLEHLYKEFPPLLPVLVHHLMALHGSTNDASVRDTAVDLCLSVPARLSSQLTHLSRFVRPLMLGLRSRDHHVQDVALKSLEFWIDNLNPDYLYPILTENNSLGEFIASLTALLRPSPSKFGDLALRILGKLGGNNRLFLLHPPTMPFLALPETGVTASLKWTPPAVEEEDPLGAPLAEEATVAAAVSKGALKLLREKGALGPEASEHDSIALPDLQVRLPLDMLSALAFRLLNRHFAPRGVAGGPAETASEHSSEYSGDLWQNDGTESVRDSVLREMCKVMTDSWSDEEEEDKWVTAGLPMHSKQADSVAAGASSRSQAAKEAMEHSEDIPCVAVPQMAAGDARSSAVRAKQQAWRLLRLLLGQLLTNAVPQSTSPDSIESSLMALANSATEAAAAIATSGATSASPVPSEAPAQPSCGISADGVIMQSATVRRMLLALALAAGDSHLHGDATALLQGTVRHLTLLAVEKHTREASLTGSKAAERLPYVVSSLPAQEGATVQPGTSFNPLVLTDVIVTLCCGSAHEPLLPVATDMLAVVLSTLQQLQGLAKASEAGQANPAAAAGIGLFLIDDLTEQISHAAFVRSYRTQQGAAGLVLALSRMLPRMVLAKRMPALVRAIIHVTKHVSRVQAATTLFAARAALDSMWRAVYLPCAHVEWGRLKDSAPDGTVLLKIPLVLPGVKAHAQALRSMRCQLLPRVSAAEHAEAPRAPHDMPGMAACESRSAVAVLAVLVCPPGQTLNDDHSKDGLERFKAIGLFVGPGGKCVAAGSPGQLQPWLQAAVNAAEAATDAVEQDEDGDADLDKASSAPSGLAIAVPSAGDASGGSVEHGGIKLLAAASPCGTMAGFPVMAVPLQTPAPGDVASVQSAAVYGRQTTTASVENAAAQVLPHHTSSVLPVLPMDGLMSRVDRQVLEAVAKGMAAREGPTRHACVALANRIALVKGTSLSDMLAPWSNSFATIVHQHSFRRLSPMQQVGQLHMMAYLARHVPSVMPVDERSLVLLLDAINTSVGEAMERQLLQPSPTSFKGRRAAKGLGALDDIPEYDADPEAAHSLRVQVSPAPYLWPDPMELGWPHYGVRGDMRVQYARTYTPARALSHSHGAMGAPRAACVASVGPTCTAECVHPETFARDEQLPSWCATLKRLTVRARGSDVPDPTPSSGGIGLDCIMVSPNALATACGPDFGEMYTPATNQPLLVAEGAPNDGSADPSGTGFLGRPGSMAAFESDLLDGGLAGVYTRGVGCIHPGAVTSSIAPSAIHTPTTKYALTAAVTGTPTVEYTPPNIAVILRCAVAELIHAMVDANPVRMLREGAPTAEKNTKEDGTEETKTIPGANIGRLSPTWMATLRGRFYRVLLTSQFAAHPAVVASSHAAFSRIMSHPSFQRSLLRDMLQGPNGLLRTQLQMLSTERPKFSTATLRGIGAMFTLLSDYFNETLADTVLDHLRKWRDPDSVQKQRIAPRGREVDVAALLFNLLHLLPCRKGADGETQAVPQQVISLWRDIADLLYRYRSYGPLSSPLLEPVARLLERFPQESLRFFLDPKAHHLAKPLVANMMVSLVQHPNSVSIRRLLASQWGATVVCQHLLRVRPKTRSMSQDASGMNTPQSAASPNVTPAPGAMPSLSDTPTPVTNAPPSAGGDDDEATRRSGRKRRATQVALASAEQDEDSDSKLSPPGASTALGSGPAPPADTAPTPAAVPAASPSAAASAQGPAPDSAQKLERAMERAAELQYQGLRLVRVLSKTHPRWLLTNNGEVVKQVLSMWRDVGRRQRLHTDDRNFVRNAHEVRLMAKILMTYLRVEPGDVDVYLHLLSAQAFEMHVDTTFVKDFLSREVPATVMPELRAAIIQRYVTLHSDTSVEDRLKKDALHILVLPVLQKCLQDEQSAVAAMHKLRALQSGAEQEAAGAPETAPRRRRPAADVPTPAVDTLEMTSSADIMSADAADVSLSSGSPSRGEGAAEALTSPAPRSASSRPLRNSPGKDITVAPSQYANGVLERSEWHLAVRASPLRSHIIQSITSGVKSGEMDTGTAALLLRAREDSYPLAVDKDGEPAVRRVVEGKLAGTLVAALMGGDEAASGEGGSDAAGDDKTTTDASDGLVPASNAAGLQVEVLRLAALLISGVDGSIIAVEHRKVLIKYAWSLLKSKDVTVKQWACITACKYVAKHQTPPKIIMQVFVTLLRDQSATHVGLVREALRTITPALPARFNDTDMLMALKWVKRILHAEINTPRNMIQVWRLLVQHERVFYARRSIYVPLILHALPRVALASSATVTHRELTVALIALLIKWDTRACQEGVNRSIQGSAGGEEEADSQRTLTQATANTAGNLLLKLVVLTGQVSDNSDKSKNVVDQMHVVRRALRLLHALLQLWPDTALKAQYLVVRNSGSANTAITFVPLISVLVQALLIITQCPGSASNLIPSAAGFIMHLLTPTFAMSRQDDPGVPALHKLVRQLLSAIMDRFPLALPAARMRHVRFWPWLASCISFRLSTTVAHKLDDAREYAKTASEVAEPETQPLEQRLAASAAAQASGLAVKATPHKCIPGVLNVPTVDSPHVACMNEQQRSTAYSDDDTQASSAWRQMRLWLAVNASEDNVLSLLRLLMLIAAKSPTVLDAYASCLLRLLSVLLSEHLGETRADEKPGKGGAGDPLPPLASDANKKDKAVNISKRLESIILLVKLLGSRALSLQPQKLQQFLDLLNRAIPKSTSARLLWECLPLLRMLLSGTPTATAGNTVGLTQKQKLSLVYSLTTLGVFAAADVRGVHSPVTQRAIQLGADYAALQRAYLMLALDLYRGRPSQASANLPVWWQHSLPGAKVPHGWARPTALLRQMLQSTLMAGTLAGDTWVRQQCMEVMVDAAQSKNESATAEWLAQWAELSPMGTALDTGARRQKRRLAEQWRELPGFMYTPCPIGQGSSASSTQQAPRTGAAVALATLLNSSWDQFASHVWIAVATRLLLRGVDASAPLVVSTLDEVLPPVGTSTGSSMPIEAEDGDLGHAHAAWLQELAAMKEQSSGDLISSLDCLSHLSLDVAVHMWRQLMPAAWRTLTPWQRRFIVPHLSVLLCKDVHHLQIPGAAADALDIVVSHATREGAWQGKHAIPEPRWYAPVWCGANGGAAGAGTGIAPGSIMAGGTRDRAFAAAYRAPADADMCGTGNAAMSSWGINVVQLLMFGIVACEPRPMFRPEVLRYVARTFGCWEMALPLLEEQTLAMSTPLPPAATEQLASKGADGDIAGLMAAAKHLTRAMRVDGLAALEGSALPAHAKAASEIGPVFNLYDSLLLPMWPDSESSTGPQQETRVRSLIALYSELGADDLAAGVRRRFSASPLSRIALTLESHGKWQMAYDVYAAAMQHAANDHQGKQGTPAISKELPAGAQHGGAPIASSVTVVSDVDRKRPPASQGGAVQALLDAARAGTVVPLGDMEHVPAAAKRKGTKRGRAAAAAEPAGRARKKRGGAAAPPVEPAAEDASAATLALLNGRPPRKTQVPSGMAALQALAGVSLDAELLGTEGFGKPWSAPDVQLARKRAREDDAIDTRETLTVPHSAAEPVLTSVSAVELGMWEQRWVEACKQLTFWPVLKAYASATQDSALLADACSKLGEWGPLQKLLSSPQLQTAALYAERVKLYEVECAVMNFKLQSSTMQALEGTNNSAVSLILKRWMLLPSGMAAHKAHERLLADTQRLREVREAIAVAQAVENSISRAQRPDLKPVLGTWRERLPNVWEGLPVWDNILTWRHHVFNATVDRLTSFLLGDLSAEEGSDLHDATWTVIKVADTARKLDLPGVCALTLSRLMEVTSLDLHDAFAKARQQMIVALPAAKQGLYPGGKRAVLRGALSLLNCTDMGLFESDQRAELMRMKGMYWAELGPGLLHAPEGAPADTAPGPDCWSQANTELAAAVRVHNSLAKGWLTWGKFLQSVFDAAVFPHLSRETSKLDLGQVVSSAKRVMAALPAVDGAAAQDASADETEVKALTAAAALPIAVQAIVALLFAVNHNCKDAPLQLARVLALLDNDTPTEVLSKALNKYGAQVPSWLWVAWVPQLLTLLSTPSAEAASAILSALVLNFPQALYFQLATFKQQRSSLINKSRGQLVTKNPTTLQLADGREVPVPPGTDARALKTLMRQRGASVTQDPHTEYRSSDFKVLPPPSLDDSGESAEAAPSPEASPAASPTGSDGKGKGKEEDEGASGRHADVLMKQLISKHGHVETLMYYFSDAVTSRLTSPGATARASEEELLGLVDSIANRTLHALAPGSDVVPARSADGLQRAFAQVFTNGATDSGKRSSAKFKEQYRLAFARDLLPNLDKDLAEALQVAWEPAEGTTTVPNPHFASSLLEFLGRLDSWRHRLRAVLVRSWQHLLFQYSSFLADLHHSQLEVPGQYTDGSVLASSPPPKVRVLGMDPYVAVGTSPLHNIAQRTVTILGDDGRPYRFHVQAVTHVITQSDARTTQQATLLNRLLASHHDSRSRQLSLSEPAVVPVSTSARLLAAEPGTTSVGAVAEAWLARNGHTKDAPLKLFMACAKEYIDQQRQGQAEDWQPSREVKVAAVQGALQRVRAAGFVHATALRQHIANSSTCPDVQAQIRARFSRQYGATALLSWAVNAHARSSHRLQISLASGNATLLDTRPSFHPENGMLNPRDSVPFRMTPQLQCFLTPIAIDGPFANSFTAAATALMGEADWFRSHSTLYQRDELLAWRCRGKVLSDKRSRELSSSMRAAWLRNVRGAVDRITNMLPPEKVDLNKVPREWFNIKMHVEKIEAARSAPKAARPSPDVLPPKDIVRSLCDGQVYELLASATNESLIAVMALPWAPWL